MTNLKRALVTAGAVLGLALLPGCGRKVEYGEVEGVVRVGGKPTAGVLVQFLGVPGAAPAPTSLAITDVDGRYKLITGKGESAVVATTYHVCLRAGGAEVAPVAKPETEPEVGADGALIEPAVRKAPEKKSARPGPNVPAAYGTFQSTPLKGIEVKPGPQTLDFDVPGS